MNSSGKSSSGGVGVQGGEKGGGSAAGSAWREEGEGADLSAVSAALTALLLGYLDAALPQPPTDQHHSSTAAAAAGGTAEEDMQVCAHPVLWLCKDTAGWLLFTSASHSGCNLPGHLHPHSVGLLHQLPG